MTDPDLTAVLAVMARLEQRIAALEDRPAGRLATTDPASPPVLRAWWWPHLDAAETITAWGHLGAWVRDELLARQPAYRRALRPCWRRHPDVVDELTALRVVWLDAYLDPAPAPAAAIDYLGRLPVVLARIEAAYKNAGCKTVAGAYVHADNDAAFALDQWAGEQIAAFIDADTADRAPAG